MHGYGLRYIRKTDPVLLGVICWFIGIWFVYGGSVPYLDGGIDLVKIRDFSLGGFPLLFQNWSSAHPPLKILFVSLFFSFLGISARAYTLPGMLFGIAALISLYFLVKKLKDALAAQISILLLALSPLFLASGLFGLIDYLLACIVIISFAAYLFGNVWLWGVMLVLAVLTKETGVLLPVAFFVPIVGKSLLRFKYGYRFNLLELIMPLSSLAVFRIWLWFVRTSGKGEWSDWIFSSHPGRGAMDTILTNVKTGEIFNPYAHQNWLHLFVLNWQWLIVLIAAVTACGLALKILKTKKKRDSHALYHGLAFVTAAAIFFILYSLLVLSFQTYTIPRYVLPAEVLLYIPASVGLSIFLTRYLRESVLSIFIIFLLLLLRLFSSVDPVSKSLWGIKRVMGENLYALNEHLSGNDGFTYNGQFLDLARYRTRVIREAELRRGPVQSIDCYFTFPDPNNDFKVLPYLGFTSIPLSYPCISVSP